MPLEVEFKKRKLLFNRNGKDVELEYPSETMTPEEAFKHYAGLYPEINNATITGPEIKNDTAIYKASTKAGRLG